MKVTCFEHCLVCSPKVVIVCYFVDRHVEKENLADFISKKREMFLVQVWLCNMTFVMLHVKKDNYIVVDTCTTHSHGKTK